MNDMSGRAAVSEARWQGQEHDDFEGGGYMSERRKRRARLPRDSGWAARLNDVVARANKASVFAPQTPEGETRTSLFVHPDDIDHAPRTETWVGLRQIQPRARCAEALFEAENRLKLV